MKIINAIWTPRVNMLSIECSCGKLFKHRADKWKPRCPECGSCGHLSQLRAEYFFPIVITITFSLISSFTFFGFWPLIILFVLFVYVFFISFIIFSIIAWFT